MTEVQLTTEPTLYVSEIFGPTIQGEGISQGLPVVFLRLGLCNLDCGWCDTPYTWDWTGRNGIAYDKGKELHRATISDVVNGLEALTSYPCRLVVSGGEPFIQQRRLSLLVKRWSPRPVEIETNGTITPSEEFESVQINCSPKLSNSGIDWERRIVPEALERIVGMNSTFKFVVSGASSDLQEIAELNDSVLKVDPSRIYLMPEGITQEAITERLPLVMAQAVEHGYGVSPRLHVLAYGDRRGV
jgi:7-carboxy-7-deazaguanine synthase